MGKTKFVKVSPECLNRENEYELAYKFSEDNNEKIKDAFDRGWDACLKQFSEVPDREDEMREKLKALVNHYEDVLKGDFSSMSLRSEIDSAKELLNELK